MYFVKFSKKIVVSSEPAEDMIGCKDFNTRGEALDWLFANGFKPDCVLPGRSPYDSNMFWNAEQRASASGWSYQKVD